MEGDIGKRGKIRRTKAISRDKKLYESTGKNTLALRKVYASLTFRQPRQPDAFLAREYFSILLQPLSY